MLVDVEGAANDDDARRRREGRGRLAAREDGGVRQRPEPGPVPPGRRRRRCAVDPGLLDVSIGGVALAVGGVIPPSYFEPASPIADEARAAMKEAEVAVARAAGRGAGRSRALGCDLSYEYVRINGEYTT